MISIFSDGEKWGSEGQRDDPAHMRGHGRGLRLVDCEVWPVPFMPQGQGGGSEEIQGLSDKLRVMAGQSLGAERPNLQDLDVKVRRSGMHVALKNSFYM